MPAGLSADEGVTVTLKNEQGHAFELVRLAGAESSASGLIRDNTTFRIKLATTIEPREKIEKFSGSITIAASSPALSINGAQAVVIPLVAAVQRVDPEGTQ
jgi:hypothetical protein